MASPSRLIMHLDMDAFFASVEQVDNPELKGKPVIIGNNDRGVVSAASYEARVFGVRSAMPVVQARRLCPQGVFLPGTHGRYSEVSRQVMDAVRSFSPLMEQTSVDEAYVDVTGMDRLVGPPMQVALAVKRAIREATGLTASVGMAPNKFLAKICSDKDKPDGVFILEKDAVQDFLKTLPVGDIPGVGKRMVRALEVYQVSYAAEIQRFSRDFWLRRFGEKGGVFLWERGHGRGSDEVVPHSDPKSCGAENTFQKDTRDYEILTSWLYLQAERVGRMLRRKGLKGRTITLKLKYADFTSLTRSHSLHMAVDDTENIFRTASELLERLGPERPVRLIGISVSGFGFGSVQLGLLDESCEDKGSARLDRTLDAIQERFGAGAVQRGRVFGFKDRS
ncbi:DNA polymerase IV [Desulfohalovibrio reitneri]|uniref:DNA polymerase IV n=1 Tax=Desulfohalovibrio reitneri TaxID=1307759 RepID=UPI000AA610E0|nr:DNA polymerase IV [Desulfohalovibrio reitneri]